MKSVPALAEVLPIQENQQNTANRSRKSLVFSFAKTSKNLVFSLYCPEKVSGWGGGNVT